MRSIYDCIQKLLAIVLFFYCIPCSAQSLGSLKKKYEYVGITSNEFNSLAIYGKQRNINWCWAACIQMVMNYNGIPILQEEVVKKSLGKLVDKPADPNIMFKALNDWEVDVFGNKVLINSNFYSTNVSEITSFLSTNKPLIVGLKQQNEFTGHAYVLIGMYYEVVNNRSGSSKYEPHSVILIDPWPGNESVKDMSWAEFTQKLIVSYKIWVN